MRRVVSVLGLMLLFLGLFWSGRESSHGLGAFWEQWWSPVPLVAVVLGLLTVAAVRKPSLR